MQNGVDGPWTGDSEPSSEPDSGGRSVRVALVGETDDIHGIIGGYLSEEGYEVTARDPELVEGADSGQVPDLVVFNPERSQIDEADLPRQQVGDVTIPVLVVVSPLMTRRQGSVSGRGPIEWLVKPFDRDELVEKVDALLGNVSGARPDRSRARDGPSGGTDAAGDAEATPDEPAEAGTATGSEADPEPTPDRTDAGPTQAENEPGVGADPEPAPANRRETAAIRDEIDDVRRRLAELSAEGADVGEIETEVTALSAEVSNLRDRVDAVDGRVEQVTDRTDEVESGVDANDDRIESLTLDVEENEAAAESLAEGIEALTDQQTRLAEEIDAVAGRQAELESTLDDLAAWKDEVSAAFDALADRSE